MIIILFQNEYFLNKILIYYIIVSYSNSVYEKDFFDVTEIYFNSTSQTSGSSSAVDLDELDTRHLQKRE